MYCVGAKIAFKDGRQAVARNAEEMLKIFAMNVVVTGMTANADSITLTVKMKDDGGADIEWDNFDTKEKNTLTVGSIDDVKKIGTHFMNTGECSPEFTWNKA